MKHLTPLKLSIYGGMILGFLMLESPAIMLANRIEPMLMGLPFLLVWNLFWWFLLTALFLVAYLTNWGSPAPTNNHAIKQL
ncbi:MULTISPECIES: hypothetical protein [unclassified Halomonas]|uniref:hypothetical protein n=1 Tax=unclassified Halomonas TaxID=2609666 RepID=UPI0009908E65|nr:MULTISPECIES: hypothetical protein [unclassified Halomonas]AQU83793.1 hypothetical protein B2G49_15155 [Halomonas sp. 'Soap Lake \